MKYNRFILPILALLLLAQPALAATLKLATIAPEGSFWMKEMRRGAKEISERTDGRVKLKFYPGGVMGNDRRLARRWTKIRLKAD